MEKDHRLVSSVKRAVNGAKSMIKVSVAQGGTSDALCGAIDLGHKAVDDADKNPVSAVEHLKDMSQAHITEEPSILCSTFMDVGMRVRINRISEIQGDLDESGAPQRAEPKALPEVQSIYTEEVAEEAEPEEDTELDQKPLVGKLRFMLVNYIKSEQTPEWVTKLKDMCKVRKIGIHVDRDNTPEPHVSPPSEKAKDLSHVHQMVFQTYRSAVTIQRHFRTHLKTKNRPKTPVTPILRKETPRVQEKTQHPQQPPKKDEDEVRALRRLFNCKKSANISNKKQLPSLGVKPRQQRLVGPGAPAGIASRVDSTLTKSVYHRV